MHTTFTHAIFNIRYMLFYINCILFNIEMSYIYHKVHPSNVYTFLFVFFLLYFQGCSVITSICIQKMFISLIRKKVLISTCSLSETSPTPETFNLRSESMWFPILGFEYKQKHTMKKKFFFSFQASFL